MIRKLSVLLFMAVIMLANEGSAQYQKVNSHGLDIYFRIFGKGTPILIVGGGPGDVSDRVLGICDLLSQSYQCILVDQRGTGLSSPTKYDSTTISVALTLDDFETIRTSLGYKDWVVLGASYGGYLASLYAADYPASISSIIFVGTAGLNMDLFAYFLDNIMVRLQPADIEVIKYWDDSAIMAQDPQKAQVEQIRAMMPAYFYDRNKSLLVSEPMELTDFNFDVGRWIFADIGKRNLDLTKMGLSYDKPVLILHGRQDPMGESIPQIVSRFYAKSKLVFLERCGHYSWVEQPEPFYAAIKDFLPPGK
ncbi:MAG: alpha/beta hydrolase [candidate division Zixibacteria bacterium]|nr:alpha/beta hydrolase [candidate division Zixibacteria bacterium]